MNKKLLLAKELHKPVRKRFEKRAIITNGIDDLWAADLIDMKKYLKENKGYVYILNVIDTFSKFAWGVPIKSKDGVAVSKAFEKVIKNAKSQGHRPPNLLHTDKGKEFENKHFKGLLDTFNIHMYHTENLEKPSIVERFNGTINGKLKLKFEVRNNKKWFDILQNLLDEYNFKDGHRTIGMTPSEVNRLNESTVLHTLLKNAMNKKAVVKFRVGDRVRIPYYKYTFGNKYDENWTREIFVITEILNTRPVTYKIKDLYGEKIVGSF
jgi:transposase InsO family protein